jgi:hypothetical protein
MTWSRRTGNLFMSWCSVNFLCKLHVSQHTRQGWSRSASRVSASTPEAQGYPDNTLSSASSFWNYTATGGASGIDTYQGGTSGSYTFISSGTETTITGPDGKPRKVRRIN